MVISMTGYGRSKIDHADFSITVEVRSVNHRFKEVSVRLPRQLLFVEDKIKKIINDYVRRGRIDVFVTVEGEKFNKRRLDVDWDLMQQYVHAMNQAKKTFHLSDEINLQELVHFPDLFIVTEIENNEDELTDMLLETTRKALANLYEMRKTEGQSLVNDVKNRLEIIDTMLNKLSHFTPEIIHNYRNRLTRKVKEFLDGSLDIDEAKILTEVAVYAEKSDISEEITRLRSHVEQFLGIIHSNESIGRKLDFLVQEMNREINTIGSKSNDVHISQQVVDMKSELEKIKEQIQNVE